MKTWATRNGYKIYKVLSGRSNSYLVSFDGQNVLIDTGKESAYHKLIENIKQLKLPNSEISHLILTHTHFDHCQSAFQIKIEYNCPIIVSGNAADSISNGYKKIPDGTFATTKIISKIGQFIGKRKYGFKSFVPNMLIDEAEDFQINNLNLKVLQTPGHSDDSISIIVDNQVAIVGDALFGVFKNSVFPPYADQTAEMVESWGKLLNTNCEIFLPGHGWEITRSLLQKEYDKFKSHKTL